MAVLVGAGVGLSAASAPAQEDLNRGKTPAQLYASDCAECHRNPRALPKRDNANALGGFLRVHYTASRESAAAIASYLVSLGPDPRAGSARPGTPARSRPAASRDQSKSSPAPEPAAKPAEPAPPTPPETIPEAPAAAPAAPPAGETPAAAPPANPQ